MLLDGRHATAEALATRADGAGHPARDCHPVALPAARTQLADGSRAPNVATAILDPFTAGVNDRTRCLFTVLSQYHKQMVDVTKWLIAGAIITTTGIITSHQLIRPWNWFRPVVMLGANLFLLSVLLFLSRTDASALNLSLHSTFVVAFFVTVLISTAVGRIANASPKP